MKTTTQVYFDGIQAEILRQLQQARHSIKVAVAWFTDKEILQALTSKAKKGVAVELILSRVSLNDFDLNPKIYRALKKNGGEVLNCGAADFREGSVMHNKFAVIDYRVVITGSYNWTNQAQRNEENIVVISDEFTADFFVEKFEALKANSTIFNASDENHNLELSFTCTKNLVDSGQTFELHWETHNADQVAIDNGIGIVPTTGSRNVSVQRDTCFKIEASNNEETIVKSLWVKIIRKPTLDYELTCSDPRTGRSSVLSPSSPLRDSYSVIAGMNLMVHWKANHAELVRIDGKDVDSGQGSLSFTCDTPRSFTIEAFGIKHRVLKSFSVNPIPIPKLDRVISPLPGNIQIYSEFDFVKVDVPSSFTISGNPLSFRFPKIRQLKAKLVNWSIPIPTNPLRKKRGELKMSRLAKRNKSRLRNHLLATFSDSDDIYPFLEKILKRYE